jgi:hypothetical protein
VGCRSRFLSRGRISVRVLIVGVRNDEMNGTKSQPVSQPTLYSNPRSRGQNSPRCDSIARIWMVSTDTQAAGRLNTPHRGFFPGVLRVITRAVYFLNRSHSSRERSLNRD